MDYSLISVRYAKALYDLSKDKNITPVVNADMELISKQFIDSKEFITFLQSSVVTASQKKELFKNVFSAHVNEITIKFLLMVVNNGREALLDYIARDFSAMYKKDQNIKTVTFYTAVELDDDYLIKIKAILTKELKSNVELDVIVRKHLIGGFMLMLDGKLIDTSISTKLNNFKKQLLS